VHPRGERQVTELATFGDRLERLEQLARREIAAIVKEKTHAN